MPYNSWVPAPYRPNVTPFPQNAGFGVGEAANNFVSNLIAASLYQQQQEQESQRRSLAQLGLMGQVGGREALNAPSAQPLWGALGHQGGMQLPETPEDRLRRLQTEQIEAQRGALGNQWGMPPALLVEMLKQEFEKAQQQRNFDMFGRLTGGGQPGAGPFTPAPPPQMFGGQPPGQSGEGGYVPAPAPVSPPSAPMEGQGGLTPRFTADQTVELGPQGLKVQQTRKTANEDQMAAEARGAEIRRSLLTSEASMENIRSVAEKSGYDPSFILMAKVNDQLRGEGFKIPAEAPSSKMVDEAINKREDRGLRREQFGVEMKRLDKSIKDQEIQLKHLQRLIEQGDRQTAGAVASMGVATQKEVVMNIRQAIDRIDKRIQDVGETVDTPENKKLKSDRDALEGKLADAVFQLQQFTQQQMELLGGRIGNQQPGRAPQPSPRIETPPPTGAQSPVSTPSAYPPGWFRKPGGD